jgi:uncharacterized protein (DUF1697 family)
MPRQVLFLRGVNVAGRGKFAMADFKRLLDSIGATAIKTHVNSGNAAFTIGGSADATAREMEKAIEAEYGVPIRCFARTAAQLREIVDNDPFAGVADSGSKYVVLFLDGDPDPGAVRDIEKRAGEFAPEQFAHKGREFYVWCPNGLRDAKLPLALGHKRFRVLATSRNWNTVKKMLALAEAET